MFKNLIIIGSIACALVACEKPRVETPAPDATMDAGEPLVADVGVQDAGVLGRIKFLDGPKPTDDTLLAEWNDVKVTMADYDRATRIGRLFAPNANLNDPIPEIPAEGLAMPTVHYTTTRGILSRAVVAQGITKYKLKVTDQDARKALAQDGRLKEFASALDTEKLEKQLNTIDLTSKDLVQVGWDMAAQKILEDFLVRSITEDEVWQSYQYEHRTVRLAAAMGPNIPSSSELSEFVEKNETGIQKYFEENKRDFRVPRRVRVDLLRPEADQEVKPEVLEEAAKRLEKEPIDRIATELGLKVHKGQFVVRGEIPKAFDAEVNDTGFLLKGPRGALVWRVRGFYPSHIPELDRSLRRQVAAEMMRRQAVVPSLEDKLEKARKVLKKLGAEPDSDALKAAKSAIEALGLEYSETPSFPRRPNGSVPGFGLAQEVSDAAFSLTDKKTTSEPILSRERGFVVHLLERTDPVREDFDASKEAVSKAYRKEARSTIVDRYVQAQVGSTEMQFDLKPLARKYGVYRK